MTNHLLANLIQTLTSERSHKPIRFDEFLDQIKSQGERIFRTIFQLFHDMIHFHISEVVDEYLQFLLSTSEAHLSNEKYYWMADQYPAADISLRSASPQGVVLQARTEDDRPWTVGTARRCYTFPYGGEADA